MKQSITDLQAEDRPREKFEANGGGTLSTAELLAILVGSGNAEENAVALMQRLVGDCDGRLSTLSRMSIAELCRYKGVGKAKAITILAACELAKRFSGDDEPPKQFLSSTDIYHYFRPKLLHKTVEESHVLLLNQNLRLISSKLISRGGITGTVVDIRLVLKEALLANATSIALCHNHPSGSLHPSREDDALTEKLHTAGRQMDINLIDHLIITDNGYYSYQDEERI